MYYHRQRKFTYILIYLGAMHFAFINSSVYYCLLTYLFRGKKLPIKKTFTSCISTYLVVVVPFIRCKDIKKFFKKATHHWHLFTLYIHTDLPILFSAYTCHGCTFDCRILYCVGIPYNFGLFLCPEKTGQSRRRKYNRQ